MPTLLVTKQMSPALAARVQASVSGRRSATPRASRQRPLTAILRLAILTLLVASVSLVLYQRRRSANELAVSRKTLIQAVEARARALTPSDRDVLRRVETALATYVTTAYAGDFIAEDLRSDAGLSAALRVPTLYIRGPLEGLQNPRGLPKLSFNSGKDAFLLCMLDPPEARSEKALHAKARAATARGPSMQAAAHIERLAPLLYGLPFLMPTWIERVRAADDSATLSALRKQFEAAPLEATVRAAKVTQLLTVVDEPGSGPIELDGERRHGVRVVLSELGTGELRIRFRREVDPAWISANIRAEYAAGIDSCALATDLRNSAVKAGVRLASDKASEASRH